MYTPPPTAHERMPHDRQPAGEPERSRRWQLIWTVLLFVIAGLVIMTDALVWFAAGWASVDGDVGVPPTPSASNEVDLCGVLTLAAAIIALSAPLAVLVTSRRNAERTTYVARWVAVVAIAFGLFGFVVGASVIQKPGG